MGNVNTIKRKTPLNTLMGLGPGARSRGALMTAEAVVRGINMTKQVDTAVMVAGRTRGRAGRDVAP